MDISARTKTRLILYFCLLITVLLNSIIMAPNKCSYLNCNNSRDKKSMFRFPVNDENRLPVWIKNCGNMAVTSLTERELRNQYICIEHFDKKFILGSKDHRINLTKSAIPKPFHQDEGTPSPEPSTSMAEMDSPTVLKVLTPRKVYYRNRSKLSPTVESTENVHEEDNMDWESQIPNKIKRCKVPDTPKCKKLKSTLKNTTKLLKRSNMSYNRLKNKINKKESNFENHKFKSEASRVLALMQLRTKKTPWTAAEKKLCLSLYYKSPATYKFMLESGIVLAAPSTIQRWLQATSCLPGINEDVFENIGEKFENKSLMEKACTVCFDEMSIYSDLELSEKYDIIEGFQDFGDGDRSGQAADHALVFIARGIFSNWKMPLAYFLSCHNVKFDKLVELINKIINKLFQFGLLPKVIVCDQATTNVKAMKELGATKEAPFFFVNGRKIFSIFDTPHLIKNIRNNLLENNYLLGENEISFEDIRAVFNIDSKNKSRSLKKLTPVHIKPNNFQKMKVSYASQVLSNSVASAIETAIESGELKSKTAPHTRDFVRIVNNMFDCLNSKNKFDSNPFRCAITKNSKTLVNKTLIKARNVFETLKKICISTKRETKLTRPPCFDGVVQTINSILLLSSEEFSIGSDIKFLITYRFNQDVLENLFGVYRLRGGCNRNPTPKGLRAIFRSNLLNNLIKLKHTNCESDSEYFVIADKNISQDRVVGEVLQKNIETTKIMPFCSRQSESEKENENFVESMDIAENYDEKNVTLEQCSVTYFAGWLGKVTIEQFNCSDCSQLLLNKNVDLNDPKQLLIINKTYENITTPTLKSPTEFLYKIIDNSLNIFEKNFESEKHLRSVIKHFVYEIYEGVGGICNYHEKTHMYHLIEKLVKVKIHDYCKRKIKSLSGKQKVRILQNM